MQARDFRFGFRVVGDCRQPRRIIDAGTALRAYAAADGRAEPWRESYLAAFQFDCELPDYLRRTGSTAGYNGPCWAPFLWLDIDAPDGDPASAREAARRLAAVLTDALGIDGDDLLCFFSGAKGWHLGIPTAYWLPEPRADFHRIARHFAEGLAAEAGATIDAGVYDRVRLFRAPNSRHPRTGLHKLRLCIDELFHLDGDAIRKRAAEPEPFELPEPTGRSEQAAERWAAAAEQVRNTERVRADRLAAGRVLDKLNRGTLDFIRDGAANGDRHRMLYSAAANLAELGGPLNLCAALLTDAALDCGLPPADVRRAIENGWASTQTAVRAAVELFDGEVVNVEPVGSEGGAT